MYNHNSQTKSPRTAGTFSRRWAALKSAGAIAVFVQPAQGKYRDKDAVGVKDDVLRQPEAGRGKAAAAHVEKKLHGQQKAELDIKPRAEVNVQGAFEIFLFDKKIKESPPENDAQKQTGKPGLARHAAQNLRKAYAKAANHKKPRCLSAEIDVILNRLIIQVIVVVKVGVLYCVFKIRIWIPSN